jgi:sugar phosphate permease
MITKNIGMLLLAIYLILVGITTLFHVGIGAIVMGVLALVAGILILVGKYCELHRNFAVATALRAIGETEEKMTAHSTIATGHNAPTAPEISKTMMLKERKIWIIAKTFAQRARSGASVGPNVELCVNATNR